MSPPPAGLPPSSEPPAPIARGADLPADIVGDPPTDSPSVERWAQPVLIVGLLFGCWLILRPFFTAILFASVIAVSTWPAYRWVLRRFRGRRVPAGLVCCLVVVLSMVGPAALITFSMVDGVNWLMGLSSEWFVRGPPPPPGWIERLPVFGDEAADYWRRLIASSEELQQLMGRLAEPLRNVAFSTGKALGGGLLQVLLAIFLLFFLYRDGEKLGLYMQAAARRIGGPASAELLHTAQQSVVGVMIGAIGTAVAQSMVAIVGFSIAGVPAPFLLGAVTFVLSLVPVGPPLIWGGASIWLFREGDTGWAVFMLAYGFFGISSVDNIIKPFLISRTSHLPFALTLLGVTGGVIGFGFMGVFIGPTLLALALSLAGLWLSRQTRAVPRSG